MLRNILLSLLFLGSSAFAKDTFHAILICDKESEHVNLYKDDIRKMEKFLKGFCKYGNLSLDLHKISAKEVTISKITGMFPKKQKKKQNVLIYYSGKDRQPYELDFYPSIKAKGNQPYFTPGLLSKYCSQKNDNSFITIIFDCYKNVFPHDTDGKFIHRKWTKQKAAIIKNLLCGHKGALTMSSSCSGEAAFGINEKYCKGGLFTHVLLSHILDLNKKTSWDKYLSRVSSACYGFPFIKDQDMRVPNASQEVIYNTTHMIHKHEEVKTK